MEILEILSEVPANTLPESVFFHTLKDRGMYPNIFYRLEKSMRNCDVIHRQKNFEGKFELRMTPKGDQFYRILKQLEELCADPIGIPEPPE
jgi:hypothetical protein